MNVILCGPPRCGKTALGKALAEALGWVFLDTDHLMEIHYKKCYRENLTTKQIFQIHGEVFFRKREYEVLQSVMGMSHSVISTGGGCVCHAKSRDILRSLGFVVYLKASAQTLCERMLKTHITQTLDDNNLMGSLEQMLFKRGPLYEALAHHTYEIEFFKQDELLQHLYQLIKGNHGK